MDQDWTMTVEVSPNSQPLTDWPSLKQSIVAKLNVPDEYRALGLKFSKQAPDSKGRLECHAISRPDEVPSAFVNVVTGVYHDSGGGGESLGFFDFALKHGSFGRWIDCIKHYAEKTGVELGRIYVKTGGRIEEAHYDYREPDGTIRYRIWRNRYPNGKKQFSQHPPDGRGGWKQGAGCMEGIEPLPYRLPELLAESKEPVWITEGEKDVERLVALGLVATTNHQGSGSTESTWPKFLEYFRGRECYIIPDNDLAGRIHARKVADYLLPVAKLVKVVALPGLPIKGDASDWFDIGNTVDELGRLAKAAPVWDPTVAEAAEALESTDATVAHLRTMQSRTSWLWGFWIPNACLTLLASEPGIGKTRFCFDLARRVYHGLDWPDGSAPAPRRGKTLWVVADNQWQEMVDLPSAFGIADEFVILNAPADDPYSGTSLETPEQLADLEARIKRVKPILVIIDTITNTSDAKSQDSSDAKKQYKPLQEIATRCQVAILCVTHLNAGGKVLGRRAVEKVRVVIQMECPDPEQPLRRKLWISKSKALVPPPLGITMGDEGNEYDSNPPVAPEEPERHAGAKHGPKPKASAKCMTWLTARLSLGTARVCDIRRAAEEEDFSTGTLYAAVEKMGVIEGEDGRYKTWSLPQNGEHLVNNGTPF